jgi:hypothetical protein
MSPGTSIPRSPWDASPAWRKYAGVPVDANVAAIFCPTRPDFPIPVTAIRPRQATICSPIATNSAPRFAICDRMESASISRTFRAASRITPLHLSRSARRAGRTPATPIRIRMGVFAGIGSLRKESP